MPTLTWLTRDDDLKRAGTVPYRLLEADPALSHGDPAAGNMLIQGDNLDALKALLPYYKGRVKCIYIDPPYNTGTDFEHYNDNMAHTQWLEMAYSRFEILRDLLSENGTFFCQLNDDEMAYAKVIMDEIFGRDNFLNQIAVRMKLLAGASGGGEDKKIKKNIEHILVYAKNAYGECGFDRFNDVYESVDLMETIDAMEEDGKSWKYTSILLDTGTAVETRTVLTGAGEEITVTRRTGLRRTTVSKLEKEGHTRKDVYGKHLDRIFSDTNAQTSIRTRIIDEFKYLDNGEMLEATYIPRSGRDKGKRVTHYYISNSIRRVIWLSDIAETRNGRAIKQEKIGTWWEGFPLNNLTKEGGVRFPNGKKPEALVGRILELATNPGDLVLDSFLGSGTTAAVAHKMGRQWIGVERGDHATTHCAPRMVKVIDGEQGGISKAVNWQGGGGFTFYQLGEPVFDEEGRIRPGITFPALAAHIWFSETGLPYQGAADSPWLGSHGPRGLALLYNGILGDKRVSGGNVLTGALLASIRNAAGHDGPLTIYGEASRIGAARLKAEGVTFKQTPYDVKAR